MQRNPRPTRAEASDVANAILDGSDAIMLSGETAAGLYPVESVQTMDRIAMTTEAAIDYRAVVSTRRREKHGNMTEAIGQAAAYTAINLKVKAVLAPTESGHTAKMIAKYRPGCPVIAVTSSEACSRKLSLVWGVYPIVGKKVLPLMKFCRNLSKKVSSINMSDMVMLLSLLQVFLLVRQDRRT